MFLGAEVIEVVWGGGRVYRARFFGWEVGFRSLRAEFGGYSRRIST